jgi:hypothetical protein
MVETNLKIFVENEKWSNEILKSHHILKSSSRYINNLNIKLTIYRSYIQARCWWLTPIILAIQEAEIRRIVVQSQPRQIVGETLS